MKLSAKKDFLACAKSMAKSDLNWLVLSHKTPNGHETAWTKRAVAAVLKRHGAI